MQDGSAEEERLGHVGETFVFWKNSSLVQNLKQLKHTDVMMCFELSLSISLVSPVLQIYIVDGLRCFACS